MDTTEMLKIQFYDSYDMLKGIMQACPDDLWRAENHGLPIWNHVIHTILGMTFWLRSDYLAEFKFDLPLPKALCSKLENDEWCSPADGYMTKTEIGACFELLDKKLDECWQKINDDILNAKPVEELEFTYLSAITAQIRHIMCHVGMCNAALIENGYDEVRWLAFGE